MQPASGLGGDLFDSLIPRRRKVDDAEFDITAMIDLVFMMNIYFLVTFLSSANGEIDLPRADHAAALDPETAVVITILPDVSGQSVEVYLGDGKVGTALRDSETLEDQVREYVTSASAAGKTNVLLKAEKNLHLRDTVRVAKAAAVEGMKLHAGVTEKDTPR